MGKQTEKFFRHSLLFVGGLVGLIVVTAALVLLAHFGMALDLDTRPQARMVVEQFWHNLGNRERNEIERSAILPGRRLGCKGHLSRRGARGAVLETQHADYRAGRAGQDSLGPGLVWVNARAWDGEPVRRHGRVVVAALAWRTDGMADWLLDVHAGCGTVTLSPGRLLGDRPALAIYETRMSCRPEWFELVSATDETGSERRVLASLNSRPAVAHGLAPAKGVWPVTVQWSKWFEWLYSAWIRHLFAEPRHTWRPLHQVIRDPHRNLFYGMLGLDEDDPGRRGGAVTMWADCADVPYQLRAYFSWKLGLAMRFRECSRGSPAWGPRCDRTWTNLVDDFDSIADPVGRFNRFIREGVAWKVHSGTLRTLPEDSGSDAYPVAVRPDIVVPGTIYVDVGGHVLVVVDVGPSDLVAVDGHPDKTVTVRRFSRARFFPFYRTLTGGLKAFRPLRYHRGLVTVTPNRDLGSKFSLEQYSFGSVSAYRRFVRFRLFGGCCLHGSQASASVQGLDGQGRFDSLL